MFWDHFFCFFFLNNYDSVHFLNLRNKNTKFKRNTIVSIILFSLPGVTQMKNTCKLRNSVFSREVKQTLYTESSFESPQRTRRV